MVDSKDIFDVWIASRLFLSWYGKELMQHINKAKNAYKIIMKKASAPKYSGLTTLKKKKYTVRRL